jgi:hypothetical protein
LKVTIVGLIGRRGSTMMRLTSHADYTSPSTTLGCDAPPRCGCPCIDDIHAVREHTTASALTRPADIETGEVPGQQQPNP